MPSPTDPALKYNSTDALVAQIQKTYDLADAKFYYKSLEDYYNPANFSLDLSKIAKPKNTFGSDAWKAEVGPTIQKMIDYIGYFIYQNFGAEGPYQKLKKEKDYGKKVILYENGYQFTMCYFYVAAGVLSLVLALLYWFGRQRKTRTEWTSIGIRILGGVCLPLGIISPLTENGSRTGFRYNYPYLIIPIVAIGYLIIIIVDNVVKAISERHWAVVETRRMSQQVSMPLAENMHISGDSTSYEIHRKNSRRISSNLHGIPEMVDHEDSSLVYNAQKPGMKADYAQLQQQEEFDEPAYHPSQHDSYPHPAQPRY